MKVNAKGVVILNAVKDLEGTHVKILHYVQDDTAAGSNFHNNDTTSLSFPFVARMLAWKLF